MTTGREGEKAVLQVTLFPLRKAQKRPGGGSILGPSILGLDARCGLFSGFGRSNRLGNVGIKMAKPGPIAGSFAPKNVSEILD